jgi:alpha-beta hydrolase superfamily lysophospholipase
MPFFDGAAGRVYYRHWATSVRPRATLVFLHGFGEHTGLYHRYAAELGRHGIDLWALDEIGHGLSDGDRGHFGSFDDLVANAEQLTRIIAADTPDTPIVIGGHSLGSLVAVLTAWRRPDRYVAAVISGAPLSPVAWIEQADLSAGERLDLDPTALSSDPFYLDQLETDPLAFTSADIAAVLGETLPPLWRRLADELPDFGLPLLAVHGELDEVAPLDGVRAWTGRIAGLQLDIVPGAGHDVLNEVAHTRVADRVAEFVLHQLDAPVGTSA